MGNCVSSNQKRKTQLQNSLKIAQNFALKLQFYQYFLSIKLQPLKKGLKEYDICYDDNSLPNQVYKEIKSVKRLKEVLENDKNNLQIQNDNLLFCIEKSKTKLSLSLKNESNQDDTTLQCCQESIKTVEIINRIGRPYSSIVMIKSYCKNQINQFTIQGSGVIIKKNTILTVAHNIYSRAHQVQAYKTEIYVQTSNKTLQKLKVLKHCFSSQYKNNNQTDLHRYDLAFIEVEKNDIIKNQQILSIEFDAIDNNTPFQIIGFSELIDKAQAELKNQSNNLYSIKCKRAIKIFQDFIQYIQKAKAGFSGGGIIIRDKNNQYKLVGLHQGLKQNFGKGILFSNKSKNSYQTMSEMASFNNQIKFLFSQNQNNNQNQNHSHKQHKNIKHQSHHQSYENSWHTQNNSILNKAKQYYERQNYQMCYQLLSNIQKQKGFDQKSIKFAQVLHFLGKVKVAFAFAFAQDMINQKYDNININEKKKEKKKLKQKEKQKEIKDLYESSLQYFSKSYQITKNKIGAVDQTAVVQNLVELAKVYQTPYLQDKKKAFQQYQKAFKIYQKTKFQRSSYYFEIIYQMAQIKKDMAVALIEQQHQKGNIQIQMKDLQKALQYHQLCVKNLEQKNQEIKEKFYIKVILSLNECNEFIYACSICKENCQCQTCKNQLKKFINSAQVLLKCYKYQQNIKKKSKEDLILLAKIGYLSGLSKNYMNQIKYYEQYKKFYEQLDKIQQKENKYVQNINKNTKQEQLQDETEKFYQRIVADLLIYYQQNKKYQKLKEEAINMKKYLQKKKKNNTELYFFVSCAYGRSLNYLDYYHKSLQFFYQLKNMYLNMDQNTVKGKEKRSGNDQTQVEDEIEARKVFIQEICKEIKYIQEKLYLLKQ